MKSSIFSAILSLAFAVPGAVFADEGTKKPSDAAAPAKSATEVKNTDASAAKKLLDDNATAAKAGKEGKIEILDVRTPEEFAEGHLASAKNIDFKGSTFEADVAKLDKNKTYLVHCRSGGRSTKSLEIFKKLGFKRIIHLDGGMMGWEAAGNKVEK